MQHSHRQAVLLWGDLAWAVGQLDVKSLGHCFWYGEHAPASIDSIAANHVTQKLRQQCDSLVVECHEGVKPDHLAALLGTLRGGGVLYLLLPNRRILISSKTYLNRCLNCCKCYPKENNHHQ